jgi:hypothetical protein
MVVIAIEAPDEVEQMADNRDGREDYLQMAFGIATARPDYQQSGSK